MTSISKPIPFDKIFHEATKTKNGDQQPKCHWKKKKKTQNLNILRYTVKDGEITTTDTPISQTLTQKNSFKCIPNSLHTADLPHAFCLLSNWNENSSSFQTPVNALGEARV